MNLKQLERHIYSFTKRSLNRSKGSIKRKFIKKDEERVRGEEGHEGNKHVTIQITTGWKIYKDK